LSEEPVGHRLVDRLDPQLVTAAARRPVEFLGEHADAGADVEPDPVGPGIGIAQSIRAVLEQIRLP
jgi:hypothetical protein